MTLACASSFVPSGSSLPTTGIPGPTWPSTVPPSQKTSSVSAIAAAYRCGSAAAAGGFPARARSSAGLRPAAERLGLPSLVSPNGASGAPASSRPNGASLSTSGGGPGSRGLPGTFIASANASSSLTASGSAALTGTAGSYHQGGNGDDESQHGDADRGPHRVTGPGDLGLETVGHLGGLLPREHRPSRLLALLSTGFNISAANQFGGTMGRVIELGPGG